MANTAISDLTSKAAVEGADLFVIVDNDDGVNKKVLMSAIKTQVCDTPQLVTPNLGTPTGGDISNCTGSPTLTHVRATSFTVIGDMLIQGNLSDTLENKPDDGQVQLTTNSIAVGNTEAWLHAPLISSRTPTGTGSMVLSNSPTLVAPALGNIASGDISNGTGTPRISLGYATLSSAIAPSAPDDDGTAGQISFDSTYLYVCVATDTWKRIPFPAWT